MVESTKVVRGISAAFPDAHFKAGQLREVATVVRDSGTVKAKLDTCRSQTLPLAILSMTW